MKQLLWKFIHLTVLAIFILVSGVSIAAADHSWSTYHWARTTDTFIVPVGDNTTSLSWHTTLEDVISDWFSGKGSNVDKDYTNSTVCPTSGSSPCISVIVKPQKATGVAGNNCGAVQGTTQVCNKTYGANGWLGLATIWLNGGHITKGTAKMNDTYLSKSGGRYNTVNERRHVMCQEVAHTFGLGHQSTSGVSLDTCMDYYSNTGTQAESTLSIIPNYHDYEQLSRIYANHLDSITTLSATGIAPAQANARDDESPKEWGRLSNQSQDGRSSVYEQDLGLGIRIIRHVRWTEETAAKCPACDHRFHDKE
ncbi:MAG: hypothetical protein HP496_02250 [Nitrospira sp.]|nr:hypothetical protein [Nitrospira sp.]